MISHRYQCIFIHIPKCAGTSIERALGHLDGHEGRNGQDHRTVRMIEKPLLTPSAFRSTENLFEIARRVHRHATPMRNERNKFTVTRGQYDRYFKFTIVRNPWARAFSWYKDVMRDPTDREAHGIVGDLSFRDFLRTHAGHGMLRPQTYWIKSFDNSIKLDYIGRFENITDDFKEICRLIGVNNIALPHELKGEEVDYRSHYDSDSIKLVAKLDIETIKMFNYLP